MVADASDVTRCPLAARSAAFQPDQKPPGDGSRLGTKESGGAGDPHRRLTLRRNALERVRHVVERRAELVPDVLHRGDRGNGDQGGDQTIFDGSRTLRVFHKLKKLGHLWSP